MAEREQLLQLGHDDVVEAGDTAEDEEQRKDEPAQIGRVGIGRVRRVRFLRGAIGTRRDLGKCHEIIPSENV